MKWLGYVLSILTAILFLIVLPMINTMLSFIITAIYAGMFIYWCFRKTRTDRKPAIKKIIIIGTIITILLIIENLYFTHLYKNLQNMYSATRTAIPMFTQQNILFIVGLGLIFIALPVLLAFLEGLTKPDEEGFVRNPLIVLIYSILTLGIYQIYWFWLIKKALSKSNIKTTTLWWFLLPFAGHIIVYVKFSHALEKRTQIKFTTWFLIFFFFSNLDILINQIILNNYILKQNHPQHL